MSEIPVVLWGFVLEGLIIATLGALSWRKHRPDRLSEGKHEPDAKAAPADA